MCEKIEISEEKFEKKVKGLKADRRAACGHISESCARELLRDIYKVKTTQQDKS